MSCPYANLNSPFPPIKKGPYPPLYEFITEKWKPHGGHLDEKVAIIDGTTGLQRTFRDQYETIGALAATLHGEMGVGRDSTVAIYSPNHVDFLSVTLAVSLCGGKLTPVNPAYTPGELEVILERSKTSVLFAHVSTLNNALVAAKHCSHVRHIVVIPDDPSEPLPEGTVALQALCDPGRKIHKTADFVEDTNSYTCILPYSSGTTGLPKGVCLTHGNLVANLLQFQQVEGPALLPDHKLISPLPFFHIYAFTVSMLYCAWTGNQVITNSGRFDFETFCKLVDEHKPQRAHLVPPILLGLSKSSVVGKYDVSSIDTIISAAAPLSSETETAVEQRLNCLVKQAWGMSELSPIGTCNADSDSRTGSIGPLVSSTEAKVVDEEGNSLGPNEPGELMIRGPQVMAGYLDDDEKTAECLHNNWLKTGDLACYDEDGFFYITDRLKELIKVRGFPVAPAELEALLLTHEAIRDAAVVPAPDEESIELPRAYVVLKEDETSSNVSEESIYSWVKEQVAPYKRLDGGIVFVDEIPKSASGKILRRILRDQLQAELR